MSKASDDVLAERQRQIEVEGWTAEHDDEHDANELSRAAVCYALYAHSSDDQLRRIGPPSLWPDRWDESWWKPKGQRRDLVRAAALLIAEIERIDRLD